MNAEPIKVVSVKVPVRVSSRISIPARRCTATGDYKKRNAPAYLAEDKLTKIPKKGNVYSIGNDEAPADRHHYILTFFCTG